MSDSTSTGSLGPDASSQAGPPRRRRWGRRIVISLVVVVLLLLILVAVTPMLLSTGAGRGWIIDTANASIAGDVKIDQLTLRWFGAQRIEGLQLDDPAGERVLAVDELTTELTLWQLMWGSRDLGEIQVNNPALDLVADEQGRTNLQRAIETDERSEPDDDDDEADTDDERMHVPFTGRILATNMQLRMQRPGAEPATFQGDATIDLPSKDQGLQISVDGSTQQGALAGQTKIDLAVRGFDDQGYLAMDRMAIEADARVIDLPTDALDTLAGAGGLLTEALGSRLQLQLDAQRTASQQQTTVTLSVTAENLSADIDVQIDAQGGLTGRGEARFVATTAWSRLLARRSDSSLVLDGNVPAEVTIDRLSGSLTSFDPSSIAIDAQLNVADGSMSGDPQFGRLAWQQVHAEAHSDSLAELINVRLRGRASQQNQQGQLSADAELRRLFDAQGRMQADQLQVDATVRAENLPMALVDRLAQQRGLLVDAVGERLNLQVEATTTGGSRVDLTISANSSTIDQLNAKLRLAERIELAEPAELKAKLSDALLARFSSDGMQVRGGNGTVPLGLTIDRLSAPRPTAEQSIIQPQHIAMTARGQLGAMRLQGADGAQTWLIEPSELSVEAPDLRNIHARLATAVTQGPSESPAGQLTGHRIGLVLEADSSIDAEGVVGPTTAELNVESEQVQFDPLRVQIARGFEQLTLASPVTLKTRIDPATWQAMQGKGASGITLTQPMSVTARLTRLTVPLKPFQLARVQVEADLSLPSAALTSADQSFNILLSDAQAQVKMNDRPNHLQASLVAGTALQREGESYGGQLNASADLNNWINSQGAVDLSAATGQVDAQVKQLPTALLEVLAGANQPWGEMIGPMIDLALRSQLSGSSQRRTSLTVSSQHFDMNAVVAMTEAIELVEPARVNWTLTPTAFAALRGGEAQAAGTSPQSLALAAPVNFTGRIETLRWPLGAAGEFDPSAAKFIASLKAPAMAMRQPNLDQPVKLENLALTIDAPTLAQPITVKLDGRVTGTGDAAAEPGQVQVTARLANLFAADGSFQSDNMAADLTTSLTRIPVIWVDQLLAADQVVLALLGERADLNLQANLRQLDGSISLDASSANAQMRVRGQLAEGTLRLSEDARAQLKVTPELGRHVLAKANFLLRTAYTSERPIELIISSQNFVMPLYDAQQQRWAMDIRRVRAPRIELDLGKVMIENDVVMRAIMKVAQRSSSDKMVAWFTPVIAELRDGRLSYQRRTDVLIDNSFHIVNFGSVDLAQSQLDMVLGITGRTLDNAFGLDGISHDAVAQIPVGGPTSSPQIDVGQFALTIGRLRGQQELGRENELAGALLGGILGGLSGERDRPVPPPSVSPLPWAQQQEQSPPQQTAPDQQQQQEQQQEQAAPQRSPEEQLLEGILQGVLRDKDR